MTRREVFEKVKRHLLRQKAKALRSDASACVLRSEDGKRCAVGCLIPAKAYRPSMEVSIWCNDETVGALRAAGVVMNDKTRKMLVELQLIHDHSSPESWAEGIRRVEKEFFG